MTTPLEQVPPDEAAAIADLVALQRRLLDPKRPRRGQHAKGHGLVRGTFAVRADVPEPLRVGSFATPASYDCWVRFSNGFADDDRQPDVHGIGIKVLHPTAEHDFLLVDHDVFFAADVRRAVGVFSRHVELLASGVSPAEHDRLLVAEYPVEAVLLAGFVRPADPSPLESQYFSGTPYALGTAALKYQLLPRPENRAASRTSPNSPDFLRSALATHLATSAAAFDFCVQPQRDPVAEPVEDPTVRWTGPATPVAVLTIPPQVFDTAEREARADALSFSPWHAPAEHRPLGGINRGRKPVYELSWGARRPTPNGGSS
jgi:hypothetical protein